MDDPVVAINEVRGNEENPTASKIDGAIYDAATNMTKAQDIAIDALSCITKPILTKRRSLSSSVHISVSESDQVAVVNDLFAVDPKLVELTFSRVKQIKQL